MVDKDQTMPGLALHRCWEQLKNYSDLPKLLPSNINEDEIISKIHLALSLTAFAKKNDTLKKTWTEA